MFRGRLHETDGRSIRKEVVMNTDTATVVQQMCLSALSSFDSDKGKMTVMVRSMKDTERDAHISQAHIVWIDGDGVADPIYAFWVLRKNKILADGAHIIITPARKDRGWLDLSPLYQSILFGEVGLIVYRENVRPPKLPSMKGLEG